MTRKLSTRAGGAVLTSLLLGLAVLMTSGGAASAATLPAGSVALSSWAPQVQLSVTEVANKFGVPVYTRPGHQPDEAHAGDFMTYTDSAKGTQLAQFAIDNSKRLGILYVIFQQRIAQSPGFGWTPMKDLGSPTANHMDHVHLAFVESFTYSAGAAAPSSAPAPAPAPSSAAPSSSAPSSAPKTDYPASSSAPSSSAPSTDAAAPSAAPSSSSRWGGERAAWTRPTTTTPAPSSSPAPTSTAPSSSPAPSSSAPATSTAPTSTAPAAGLTALEQDAFNRINAERAKAGCAALTVDPKIQAVARAHSEDMRDRNYFDHATPEGVSPAQRLTQGGVSWRSMGENIARGQRDAATVVTGWMNSSGHRANIVNCGFKTSGLGVATGGNGPYWTQDFVG
jgi:uncharacterized protein YkwD